MSLTDWMPEPDYSSETDDLVEAVYLPAMARSTRYDRLSGYFSSTVYALTWKGLVDFVDRGGRIRIICSPALSIADGESLVLGYQAHNDAELSATLMSELDTMLRSPRLSAPTTALAGLVAGGILQVRLGTVSRTASANAKRMFHDKVGVFLDGEGNAVGFRGSANETFLGLSELGNVESIDVFPSWCDTRDAKRVERAIERFERLWTGSEPGVEVREVPSDFTSRLREIAQDHDWRAAIAEIELDQAAAEAHRSTSPSGRPLRAQQVSALDVWEEGGCRGILEHATGAGKTITGVTAVGRHLATGGSALVVVPSRLLLAQWAEDLRSEFAGADVHVHTCGGGETAWKELLRDWLTDTDNKRVVVAIANTASSPAFLNQARRAERLLLVADEVHRLGAPNNRSILSLDAEARLGLSATPERAGDPEGTRAIIDYFGGVIHRFGLNEAIEAGLLSPYLYEAFPVRLLDAEQEQWDEITRKLKRQAAISRNPTAAGERAGARLKFLLIQRARIAKQAAAKVPFARNLLAERYRGGERWLVYCDDLDQLNQVVQALSEAQLPVTAYHSQMTGDGPATLESFAVNGGIVVSIKCLDEGVDMPAATHALILASSRNPREFIQRRGRVLRSSPDKTMAHVFDAITVPWGTVDDLTDGLVWGEIARAAEFAAGAVNPDARHSLEAMCLELGVPLSELYDQMYLASTAGIEDDDDD